MKAAAGRIPRGVLAEIRKEERERAITAAQEDLCQMLHEVGFVHELALIHLKFEDTTCSGFNSKTGHHDNQEELNALSFAILGFFKEVGEAFRNIEVPTLSYLRTKYPHKPPMAPGEELVNYRNADFDLTYRTIELFEDAISIDRAAFVDWKTLRALAKMGADRLEDRARLVARTGLKFTAYSFEDDLTDAILKVAEAHIASGGIEDDIFDAAAANFQEYFFFATVDDVLGQFVPDLDEFKRKVIDEFLKDVTAAVATAKYRAKREAEALRGKS